MKGKIWKKSLSVLTSVVMLAGAVPMQLFPKLAEHAAIVASAGNYGNKTVKIGYDAYPGSNGNFTDFLPVNYSGRYGYTEQIYTASEVGNLQTIKALSFEVISAAANENVNVYLSDTTRYDYETHDTIGLADATLVYSGFLPFGMAGTRTIEFTTAFQHDISKNLLITVVNNSVSAASLKCATFQFNSVMRAKSTGADVYTTPRSEARDGGRFSWRNIITLYGDEAPIDRVTIGLDGDADYEGEDDRFIPFVYSEYYDHGYSEQIYSAEEVGNIKKISGISFNVLEPAFGFRGLIYLADTDKSNFYDDTQVGWDAYEAHQVYSGELPFNRTGEIAIGFDFDYKHNPEKNLAVIIIWARDENASGSFKLATYRRGPSGFDPTNANYANEAITPHKDVSPQHIWRSRNIITLYGEYEKIKVNYYGNAGSMNPSAYNYAIKGRYFYIGPCYMLYPNHDFVEWNTEADGTGNTYQWGDALLIGRDQDELTFYAQWKETTESVDIGSPNYSNAVPLSTYFNYGYMEELYTAEEIGDVGKISAIGFAVYDELDLDLNIEMYLMDTDTTSFKEPIILNKATKVFDGTMNFKEKGWNKIQLDQAFTHDPNKGMMLAVVNKTGRSSGGLTFHTYSGTSNCVNYYILDDEYTTPQASHNADYHQYKNVLRLWSMDKDLTEIGTKQSTTDYYPVRSYYNYGWSEQIYSKEEVGDVSALSAISFNVSLAEDFDMDCELYLLDTDLRGFDSERDIFLLREGTKVFDGTVSFAEKGWTEIEFDTPYYHDPEKNLVVMMTNKTGEFTDPVHFYDYRDADNCNCTFYDFTDNNVLEPSPYNGLVSTEVPLCYKNQIRLRSTEGSVATITYKANGSGQNDIVQKHISGGTVNLKNQYVFTRDGYYLTGWNSKANGSGNTYKPEQAVTWQNNVTLYAQWTPERTITYNANGESFENVVQKHAAGEKVALLSDTVFSSNNAVIAAWNTKPDGTGNTYQLGQEVSWNDNVTLYAVWRSIRTITYKANGVEGEVFVQYHGRGMSVKLMQSDIFMREEYLITGWNTKADGSGNTYTPGQEVTWNDNVTLYAIWKPIRTITYYPNGEEQLDSIVTYHGAGVKVELENGNLFTSDNAFLYAWNTKPDGSGNTYQLGQEVAWNDNVTLYAVWRAARTITYKANGASGEDVEQSHGRGMDATLKSSSTFSRQGYTFTGWNTKADGSGNTYQPGQKVAWNDNVTLYAVWAVNRRATFKPNGASGSDAVQIYASGVKFSLRDNPFTRNGYTFAGWNSKADGSGNTYQPSQQVTWMNDVTLYAIWKENRSITYKANGASGTDVVQYHGAGIKTALKPANTFTRSGYSFAGWNSKADGSGNTYQAGQEVTWTSNVTLYAQWKATRTITYKANGASGSDVVQSHGAGEKATLKAANTFTRSGYTFVGWNAKADGSGNTYQAGQVVTWNDNVTLYAQWKATRTITYKANGASGADVVQYHGAGVKTTLKPATTFTRNGYTLAGWNSKADGSGNTYAPGQDVTWTSNVTLYAVWKENRTITYKANGASGADVVQYHGAGIKTALKPASTFTRTGYTFIGWNSKADGSGNTYAAGQQVTWTSNVTLYAQWAPNRTITYKANGGTGADVVQTHGAGQKVALKPASTFTRTGYTFAGWNSKADGTGNTYAAGTQVSWNDNVTLYAKWTKK